MPTQNLYAPPPTLRLVPACSVTDGGLDFTYRLVSARTVDTKRRTCQRMLGNWVY